MKSFISAAAFALAALGVAGPALAQAVQTAGASACAISAWSADPDRAGLNVRAAPTKDAAIVGRLPAARAQAGDSYAVEFDVIGSRDGWLLIKNARFADYGGGQGDKAVFAGPGWVFADKVRFLINQVDLHKSPNVRSPVVAQLTNADHSSGPDSADIDHVYGCSGAFADVAAHMSGKPPTRGWATGICSNQVTTCP
ncbi:MAG TPA: SH3 domain-containing protein [Caulobacteraceae bacterium]|nr:SH3 domain-containing protein [Caulobacteraceae bacterium]